jgi:hypothetical protein
VSNAKASPSSPSFSSLPSSSNSSSQNNGNSSEKVMIKNSDTIHVDEIADVDDSFDSDNVNFVASPILRLFGSDALLENVLPSSSSSMDGNKVKRVSSSEASRSNNSNMPNGIDCTSTYGRSQNNSLTILKKSTEIYREKGFVPAVIRALGMRTSKEMEYELVHSYTAVLGNGDSECRSDSEEDASETTIEF